MRRHLSYSNVMATVAVFIALGGSSYAALKITGKDVENGTLTGVDVRNGSLSGADIRAGTIKSGDIDDGSLLARDFRPGQLVAGAKGDRGAAGPRGAKGNDGDTGPAGSVAMIARMNGIPNTFDQAVTFGSPSGTSAANADENAVSMVSPDVVMTATRLAVDLTIGVNTNATRRFTLSVDGVDTALSCTIVSFEDSCTSVASAAVPARSLLAIKSDKTVIDNAVPTAARIAFQLSE